MMFKIQLSNYSVPGLAVYLVNGEFVRNNWYIDFTEGGNDQVYGGGLLSNANFIPEGEVWLDFDVNPTEVKFVLLHELVERRLMMGGMEYGPAHDEANKREAAARVAPNTADDAIAEELAALNAPETDKGLSQEETIWQQQ